MSLLDFPRLPAVGESVSHGFGGRLIYERNESGTEGAANTSMISSYPRVDQRQLFGLQHSLSREDVKSIFIEPHAGRLSKLYSLWCDYGFTAILSYVASLPEEGKNWVPVKASKGVLRLSHLASNLASNLVTKFIKYSSEDMIASSVPVLDWKSNWVRSMAWHPCGSHLAVSQCNDYIRIYKIDNSHAAPITLRHPLQKNVAAVAWKPFCPMVLAVACDGHILVWQINPTSLSTRPAPSCAKILSVPLFCSPVTHLVWDSNGSFLYSSSANSGRLLLWHTGKESCSAVSWSLAAVDRICLSSKGNKLLAAYNNRNIKVFETGEWQSETWSLPDGCCRAAVWSSDETQLIFASSDGYLLYSLSFGQPTAQNPNVCGSANAVPIYDLRPVYMERRGDGEHEVGGRVQQMELSDDGGCMAVTFRDNPESIALFIISWKPHVQLIPFGLIRERLGARAELISFQPNFKNGALLTVVWSSGQLQFVPLIYSTSSFNSQTTVTEPFANLSPILFSETVKV